MKYLFLVLSLSLLTFGVAACGDDPASKPAGGAATTFYPQACGEAAIIAFAEVSATCSENGGSSSFENSTSNIDVCDPGEGDVSAECHPEVTAACLFRCEMGSPREGDVRDDTDTYFEDYDTAGGDSGEDFDAGGDPDVVDSSCIDGEQNGSELGIDCGGDCSKECPPAP